MSSSTMIHGAATRRASRKRTSVETATSAVSHAQTGTARTSARAGAPSSAAASPAKADLADRGGNVARVLEPDVCGSAGDVAQKLLANRGAARRLFDREHVEVGCPLEVVLRLGVAARGLAHPLPPVRVVGQREQRRRERIDLAFVGRDL